MTKTIIDYNTMTMDEAREATDKVFTEVSKFLKNRMMDSDANEFSEVGFVNGYGSYNVNEFIEFAKPRLLTIDDIPEDTPLAEAKKMIAEPKYMVESRVVSRAKLEFNDRLWNMVKRIYAVKELGKENVSEARFEMLKTEAYELSVANSTEDTKEDIYENFTTLVDVIKEYNELA